MADAVSGDAEVGVGRVFDRLDAEAGELRLLDRRRQLRPGEREERPHDGAAPRPDAGEAGEAAAEGEAQEHGLRLVVAVVGGRDPAGAGPAPDVLQKTVPRLPRGGLAAAAGGGHRAALRDERHAERRGQLGGAAGALGRAGVQGMVEMGGQEIDGELAMAGELGQAPEEGGRVDAAREGDDHPIAGRDRSEGGGLPEG